MEEKQLGVREGGGEKSHQDWHVLCWMAGAPAETTGRAVSDGHPGART